MGKKVALIAAGAVLMYFSAGIGGAIASGLFGGAYATGLASMTMMVGLSMVGSALAKGIPDASVDAYAGQKLQTTKTNTAAVPVVYGENRLGGNILWQKTNNYGGGTTNNDYWAIIAIAEGPIEAYTAMHANEDEMVLKGSGAYTTKYTHINPYLDTGTGLNLYDISFATDQAGTLVAASTIFGATTYTVSSTGSGSAANLSDGNITTGWTPSTYTDEWVKVISDAVATSEVTAAAVYLKTPVWSTDIYTFTFTLQYSDDDATWYDGSDEMSISDNNINQWLNITGITTASHKHWRINFTVISIYDGYYTIAAPIYEIDITSSAAVTLALPENLAFLAVHQKYEITDSAHVQLDNITATIQGTKVRDVSGGVIGTSKTYSNDPARVAIDMMIEHVGIALADIDGTAAQAAKDFCADNSLTCNLVFNQQQSTDAALQAILATMRGSLPYSVDEWKIRHDCNKLPVKTLTEDDIISGSLTVSMRSNSEIANAVSLKYVNPDDEWQSAKYVFNDSDLETIDGQQLEKIIEARGVTDKTQAGKFAQMSLNQMRYSEDVTGSRINQTPLTISFATTPKNEELEVSDVIELQHSLFSFNRRFLIVGRETDQSGAIRLQLREFCDTHYQNPIGQLIVFSDFGNALLEDGTDMLLEDNTNLLLEG